MIHKNKRQPKKDNGEKFIQYRFEWFFKKMQDIDDYQPKFPWEMRHGFTF